MGYGNYEMTVFFQFSKIRNISVPLAGRARMNIPLHVDRMGAAIYLPCANFSGSLKMSVLHGTVVKHLYTKETEIK